MQNKKILILALLGDPTLPSGVPRTGGFNQTLRELLISLAAFPIPICVITDTSQYCSNNYVRISNNIDLYRIPISESEHENQESLRDAQNRVLNDIFTILGNTISDVVLVHSFYWFSGHLAKCLNETYQIPYVHTPISLAYHKTSAGYEANCPFQMECEPIFLQNANWVLAITEQEANMLMSHYQVNPTQILVTGRSVDKVFHNPARDNSGHPRGINCPPILFNKKEDAPWWNAGAYTYLGRMVPIKGILQIVQAWAILQKRYGLATPPLWLIGGSPSQIADMREEIVQHVENITDFEVQQRIMWWGHLDQASISALFLKTLALVTHSRFEAGGRVILEAMCQGKPVIATPNGFAADYIKHGSNGYLVPYGDIERLARCMEYFIRQPYLSCSMGNAAKLTFEQIERSWNYTGIHRMLYEHYLTGEQFQFFDSRPSMPLFTQETLEKVDCFPYFDIRFSKVEWVKELSFHFSHPIKDFSQITPTDAHARHYRCKSGSMLFRVKQFYSRKNKNAIWNGCEQAKVLDSMEQLCLADISQHFSRVVPIQFSSIQGNYYVLPELDTIDLSYRELCVLLDEFSVSKLPEPTILSALESNLMLPKDMFDTTSCPKTLETAISLLENSTKELRSSISSQILLCLPQIKERLKRSRTYARFGFNYGKSPLNHVVVQNRQPMLLPTANWYWGELGLDYAIAATQAGETVYAIPGQEDNTRQLLWLVYLSWQKVLQAEWDGMIPERFWIRSFAQAMLKLGLKNELVKF